MKYIGILAPIFSLPNYFGIGDFSESAYFFIDYLARIRYSCWQILPLNPTDTYGSPYTPVSSFAIDDIYVSLTDLKRRGLIGEITRYDNKIKRINYNKVRKYKNHYFDLAYSNFVKFNKSPKVLEDYKKKSPYVVEYAYFVVLRRLNKYKPWNQWKIKQLNNADDLYQFNKEIFKQYILHDQWDQIHRYAKKFGITIIGDIPFYVGYDSAEVYFHREAFLLDAKFNPTVVAGVPPDYFSETGQLWGNPIYNWEYLKEHDFNLVSDRILHASKIYDVTRLDHFRAFDTYYVIPYGAPDAKIGEWKEAPGYEFFDSIFKKRPSLKVIAEDLGDMREEVYNLRDHYQIPGMQVVEFTLIDEEIRHNFCGRVHKRENSIIYVSTHDSETGAAWFNHLDNETKDAVSYYLETTFGHHHVINNLFNYAVNQPAKVAILSLADILHLGEQGRINTPGLKSRRNWTFRIRNYVGVMRNEVALVKLATRSGRVK